MRNRSKVVAAVLSFCSAMLLISRAAAADRVAGEPLSSVSSAAASPSLLELNARIKALEAAVDQLNREKADQQIAISELTARLAEVKKKLTRAIEISNTQLKTYGQ